MKKQKAKKYYAVARGRKTGIYTNWEETKRQVNGFLGAIFKSFKTQKKADDFIKDQLDKKNTETPKRKIINNSELDSKEYTIVYTDGGALGNPGPGGYGIVINGWKKFSEGFKLTTNNRMELMAVIKTLEYLINSEKKIIIYLDSSYVINGINKGWAKKWKKNKWFKSNRKPVLNSDLWKKLLKLSNKVELELKKVKGHSDDPLNDEADRLVKAAARSKAFFQDTGYLKSIRTNN